MPGDFDVVKERVDIATVIGAYVPLKKAGRIYKALCPFHTEKTPSFTVDPDRRTYKCFGCSRGGDVFTFLEEKEGLSRGEALERLAKEAGVELSRKKPEEREEHKRLLGAHDAAYFYFRQALRGTPGGKLAATYLEKRGIRPETVEKFGLGYAPDQRQSLLAYLRKKGYSDEEAVESGLVFQSDQGELVDRFRHRVIVPIRDAKGRPIAFAGRALHADERAKYVNSPTTPLFEKSRVLFALDLARSNIRKAKEAVVVEGQFDAIAAHQAGVTNVVASQGTALTVPQYEQLKGAERVVFAFDPDTAGQRAAETRGRQLFDVQYRLVVRTGRGVISASSEAQIFVAVLPPGTDPDELVRRDPDAFRAVLAAAKPVVEFLLDVLSVRHRPATPSGRREYLRDAVALLAGVTDPLAREVFVDRVAATGGVPQEVVREAIRTAKAPSGGPSGTAVGPTATGNGSGGKRRATPERYVMAQLIRFPDRARHLELSPQDVTDPELRSLYERLRAGERPDRDPAMAALAAELASEVEEPASYEELVTAVERAALRVREQRLRRRLEESSAAFAREPGDTRLSSVVAELVGELRQVTEALDRHTSPEPLAVEED